MKVFSTIEEAVKEMASTDCESHASSLSQSYFVKIETFINSDNGETEQVIISNHIKDE